MERTSRGECRQSRRAEITALTVVMLLLGSLLSSCVGGSDEADSRYDEVKEISAELGLGAVGTRTYRGFQGKGGFSQGPPRLVEVRSAEDAYAVVLLALERADFERVTDEHWKRDSGDHLQVVDLQELEAGDVYTQADEVEVTAQRPGVAVSISAPVT